MRSLLTTAAVLVLLSPWSLARADDSDRTVVTSVSGDALADIIAEEGFRGAKIERVSDDLQIVVVKMEGYNVLFICDQKSGSLQVSFGLKKVKNASLRRINEWNESKKCFRAYIDKDGDPRMEYDLIVKNGVTRKTVRAFVAITPEAVKAFVKDDCE